MAKSNGKILSNSEIAGFCGRLSLILRSGISFQEGLLIIGEDLRDGDSAAILQSLRATLERGGSLAEAMAGCGRFPAYAVDMVRLGETAGELERVLTSLTEYYKQNDALSRSVKSAALYPGLMGLMLLAVVAVLVVKVLPIFQQVFASLGGELSTFAQGLTRLGEALSANAVAVLIVLALLVLLIPAAAVTARGRQILRGLASRLFPKTGEAVARGRFAAGMALTVGSGLDVDTSLEMTARLIDDKTMRRRVADAQRLMREEDVSFPDALGRCHIFSGLQASMIAIGFRTGSLDTVMGRLAGLCQEEAGQRLERLVGLIEPTLVAILSLLVGAILLSVLLPLLGVISAL